MGQYPNLSWVLKKKISNPFIKIKLHPIRDEAGRVPEKTRPIVISNCYYHNN